MYADPQSDLFDQYHITLMMVGTFEIDGAGSSCAIAGPYQGVTDTGYPGKGWERVFYDEATNCHATAA